MANQSEFEQLQEKYYTGIGLVMLGKQSKEPKLIKELTKNGFMLINESQGKLSTIYFDDFCGTHPKFPWWWGGPFGPGPDPAGPIKSLLNAEILGGLERIRQPLVSKDLISQFRNITSQVLAVVHDTMH